MSYNIPREGDMPESRMIELVKNHLGLSISTNIHDFDNVDCMIYSESTADGYEVYICTNHNSYPSITEDVFYYDHDLADQFVEQVGYGDQTFYIDEYVYNDCYFEDKLVELFAENVEDIIVNDELDITLEEINYLKQEYELENEEADSTEVV